MGNELQRKNLDLYEARRSARQRAIICSVAEYAQDAVCGGLGQRFGGRAGAVLAAELCRSISNHYQVCNRVLDYLVPPLRGVRYSGQGPRPVESQSRRYLPSGPIRALRGLESQVPYQVQGQPQAQPVFQPVSQPAPQPVAQPIQVFRPNFSLPVTTLAIGFSSGGESSQGMTGGNVYGGIPVSVGFGAPL